MKDIVYKISFHSNWHCGSGLSSGADADALVLKDKNEMPFIPGRTLKGLIRENLEFVLGVYGELKFDTCFSAVVFSDAVLNQDEYDAIVVRDLKQHLYTRISATSIDENGIAKEHSLRRIEAVLPCSLTAVVKNVSEEYVQFLKAAIGMIKRLGLGRTRGLGRCTCEIVEERNISKDFRQHNVGTGNIRKFKCTLLSDVIISRNSATEGNKKTLDYIPGSNFLGIVASHYSDFGADAMEVFHSGKVRFSDAHPAAGGARSLHVPASFYEPKLSSGCYIHHLLDYNDSTVLALQLKQCRSGYYDFRNSPYPKVSTSKTFSIKSAYDSVKRRAEDEKMFGYEALSSGLELFFEVESENEILLDKIVSYLIGDKYIGKSRSAQYGSVRIELCDFFEHESTQNFVELDGSKCVVVYADSRLVFLDDYGIPTYRPTARQLGFEQGEILWNYSQIRTFSYSPWNGLRNCFDADRCGLEKGSVLIVKSDSVPDTRYVGSYKNEGFGKVIYNPKFLIGDEETKTLQNCPPCNPVVGHMKADETCRTDLFLMLSEKQKEAETEINIYRYVNNWKTRYRRLFASEQFSSQWGVIRSIAMISTDVEDLKSKLFDGDGYLVKESVAKAKWDKRQRREKLKEFFDGAARKGIDDTNLYKAVINLAAEMAKGR